MTAGSVGDWGETRSKIVEWHDPALAATVASTRTGLEFIRGIRDGEIPPPPIAKLFGLEIRDVEPGRVVFVCEPDESAYNPIGTVHGGLVCTLADTVTACAVHTTLDLGVSYTSVDLNVSYLRPVTKESGMLTATGKVTKPGRKVAFSSAEIFDAAGKLVATATSSCLVIHPPKDL